MGIVLCTQLETGNDTSGAVCVQSGQTLLPHRATNLEEFVVEVKAGLDQNMLNERPINYIFSDNAVFNPTCAGIWAEFGVASGEFRTRHKATHIVTKQD